MAHIADSPYRAYGSRTRSGSFDRQAAIRCVLACAAAAVAVAFLSIADGVDLRPADPAPVSAKADRLSGPRVPAVAADVGPVERSGGVELVRDARGIIVYERDVMNRTSTISRGATTPMAPDSPFASGVFAGR